MLDVFVRIKKADLAFLSIGTRLSDTIKVAKNLKIRVIQSVWLMQDSQNLLIKRC